MSLTARFVTSATVLAQCPAWNRREVAFAGRSNVGKSSLINALTGIKGLARTSKTPGRTRCLNFFTLGERLGIVDLPGFGYARIPQAEADRISAMMRSYLRGRANLAALVLLIDIRRGPAAEELALAEAARSRGLALLIAATKCDKLGRAAQAAASRRLAGLGAQVILCSALKGDGLEQLRRAVLGFAGESSAGRSDEQVVRDSPPAGPEGEVLRCGPKRA